MVPRTENRLRYALRLVATVFLLSSPCGGNEWPRDEETRVTAVTETDAIRRTFAAA